MTLLAAFVIPLSSTRGLRLPFLSSDHGALSLIWIGSGLVVSIPTMKKPQFAERQKKCPVVKTAHVTQIG
jgi:hypothetical protein